MFFLQLLLYRGAYPVEDQIPIVQIGSNHGGLGKAASRTMNKNGPRTSQIDGAKVTQL